MVIHQCVESEGIKLNLRTAYTVTRKARGRITEQANVVTIFITVVLSAVCYGWIEGTLYPTYVEKYGDKFVILNHFTWYHVAFCTLFFIIGFSLSLSRTLEVRHRSYLLLASLGSVIWGFWIEDMSYFATTFPSEQLKPLVWVGDSLSGFYFFSHWIPNVYVLLCSGGFVLFDFAFLVAKKDPLLTERLTKPQAKQSRIGKLLHSNGFLIIAGALIVELANLTAASLTNLELPLSNVAARLGSITAIVLAIPLLLFLVTDTITKPITPKPKANPTTVSSPKS